MCLKTKKKIELPNLVSEIGMPAMLEQTAEEASELNFACLKLSRYIRGENKVYGRDINELRLNLAEEIADMKICIKELEKYTDLFGSNNVDVKNFIRTKTKRMKDRLNQLQEEDSDE